MHLNNWPQVVNYLMFPFILLFAFRIMTLQHIFVAAVLGYQLSMGVSCPHECKCTEAQLHVRCRSREIPRNIPPSTKRLTLDGIDLEHIPKFAFSSLRNLTYLSIEGYKINELINDTFFGLSSLEVLNMIETRTQFIHQGAFSNLPAIRNISFRNNHDIGFKTFGDSLSTAYVIALH